MASGGWCLPAPRLGARGAAGLRPPRWAGKRREKFERGKGRQQLQPRRHLGGWRGRERGGGEEGEFVRCPKPALCPLLRAPRRQPAHTRGSPTAPHRAEGMGLWGSPSAAPSPPLGAGAESRSNETLPNPIPSLSRQAARARRDPAAPAALTWAPSKNSPAESWARAAPSRAGERPASRASAASSGSEAAAPAPLPMPTCGEVCERGRCCPGPRRRAERTSPAPLAAAPRQETPAPRGARWPRGRPLGQPSAARRARRRWHRFPSYSGVTLLLGEWGGREEPSAHVQPPLPGTWHGECGTPARSPARAQRRPAAPPAAGAGAAPARIGAARIASAPLGSAFPGAARLGSARLSLAQFGSALLRPLRHGAAWLSAAPLRSAQHGTGAATGGCASTPSSASDQRETCRFWSRRRGAEGRGRRPSRRAGGRSRERGRGQRVSGAGLGGRSPRLGWELVAHPALGKAL